MTLPEPAFHHADAGTDEDEWAQAIADHGRERTTYPALLSDVSRVVVVAAHPDDETLGAAGLLASAHGLGLELEVIVLSDGEASHPCSPTHSPADLAAVRRAEASAALQLLCPDARTHWLGLPDSGLADRGEEITAALVRTIGRDGCATLLVAPWRCDGHADHDAAGAAAATAAHRTDARLLEYPVWWWHREQPQHTDWDNLLLVECPPDLIVRKREAIDRHRSQVAPLSDRPGDETLLHEGFLQHFLRAQECFVVVPPHDDALDRLHARKADPWNVADSWYEERKRALILAALPRRRYAAALEIGCSIGRLTRDLAPRCDELVAIDSSDNAVRAARTATDPLTHVTVRRATVPDEFPSGRFDLVVLSEVGYFLSPRALDEVLRRIEGTMDAGGDLLLCHWRHEIVGWPLDAHAVHDAARALPRMTTVASYLEADFRLDVLTRTDSPEAP